MSWIASISSVPGLHAVEKLRENFQANVPTPTEEVAQQFEAAVRVLETVLLTVLPEVSGLVTVSASGHANPGHQKAAGWANDSFNLSVYQV